MSAAHENAPVTPRMKATRLSSRYSCLGMVAGSLCRDITAGMLLKIFGRVQDSGKCWKVGMDGCCCCRQHSCSIGDIRSVYIKSNGGEVARKGPLAQKIEDSSSLYL